MKIWVGEGTEAIRKMKRYIHRHLSLPPPGHDAFVQEADGKELMTQFGYNYVTSLLNYCSDDLKDGMCLVLSPRQYLIITHTCYSHTRVFHLVRAHYKRVQETPRR